MTWRRATLADCHLLGAMNHQLIADEGHRSQMDEAALTARMEAFLNGEYEAILFEDESRIVAYALYHPYDQNELYLRQFFVVRDRRREGLGRKAVRLLFDEIFPQEKRIIVTALSHNQRALDFWANVGFNEYCVSFECLPREKI